jgi:hypothetical protein
MLAPRAWGQTGSVPERLVSRGSLARLGSRTSSPRAVPSGSGIQLPCLAIRGPAHRRDRSPANTSPRSPQDGYRLGSGVPRSRACPRVVAAWDRFRLQIAPRSASLPRAPLTCSPGPAQRIATQPVMRLLPAHNHRRSLWYYETPG